MADLELLVNGRSAAVGREPERSLLHVLREELGLVAAKYGCGEGACGACTVLVEGAAVRSCILPVAEVAGTGKQVKTLEGLANDPVVMRLQRAFIAEGAMQCGYCIPGMLVSARALLGERPDPGPVEITDRLEGNICRCGTYPRILRAITRAADTARKDGTAETAIVEGGEEPSGNRRDGVGVPAAEILKMPNPSRPWDLTTPRERDFFEILGDGLMVVLSPAQAKRIGPEPAWSTEGGAWLHVSAHGRVTAFTGKVDVGQDNRTALSRIVAEQLDTPTGSVQLVMGDTDLCPYDIGTFGSRSTTDAGRVLALCAATAREHLAGSPLVAGERRLVKATAAAHLVASSDGRASARTGAEGIVGGIRRYGSDLSLPGMLHGVMLRPPALGATVRAADLAGAGGLPGVTAVRDGDLIGVAAPDPLLAAAALEAIRVEWDVSASPSEADLVDHLREHPLELEGWEGSASEETGNVDAALAGAPIQLAATYTTAYIAHVPLEARCALAAWSGDRLTVWIGTQRPFGVREELSEAFGVPQERIRVVVPPTGGAYGGKHSAEVALEAARLARAAGRPVKVRWSRQEEFGWAYFRPAAVVDVRSGMRADGTIVAWDFRNLNSGAQALDTPYDVPNRRIEFQPAESPLPQGSYRALSATANTFARESHMDEIAHDVGADPLEFRLRHLSDERLAAVLRAAAAQAGWPRARGEGHALGIAGGIEKGARVAACVELRPGQGGQVEVLHVVEAVDCGRIVDRDNLRNQVEGAIVMGLGGALFEAIHFGEGRIVNGSMSQYRVPRFSDVPDLEVVLLDRPDQPSAGAGETPLIAVAPAIANAWFAATGVRLRSLPLFPA